MKESLEKMLGLALGFALLGAQALETADDIGEFLLERKRGDWHRKHGELAHADSCPCLTVSHARSQVNR